MVFHGLNNYNNAKFEHILSALPKHHPNKDKNGAYKPSARQIKSDKAI